MYSPLIFLTGLFLFALCSLPVNAQKGPTQAELNAAHNNYTDWLLTNHDYSGQRYVDLKQISRDNARNLRPVCLYQISGIGLDPFQTNPIVYQGIMYITTQYITIAFDAATCQTLWRHEWKPKVKGKWPMHRGVALKDGKVIRGTNDGYLFALDAQTGELLWEKLVADAQRGEMFTMAPLLFEDLILTGPAGSEQGVRGWIGAFRLSTGEPVWKFYTVPAEGEPGSQTWGKDNAQITGGGAIWTPLSLDVERKLLYVPVGNPAPDWYDDIRPGANLYTSSMVVLDVRTGKLQWYYQAVPHDTHDYDLTQVSPLFSTTIDGKQRQLVTVVGKDGLLHVLDRQTRKHLYQVEVTTRSNIDAPITVAGTHACPGVHGGVEWNGPAYSARTNMLYVNSVDWCATLKKAESDPRQAKNFWGGTFVNDPFQDSRGWLTAIDASSGQIRWRYKSARPLLSAITVTSSNVLFTGELTGDFLALDAQDGKELYRFPTGGPLNGGIVTYAIKGKEYVAAVSGSTSGFFEGLPGAAIVVVFAQP
jgi:alcohol dehydrogenase (cytochrome c)